MGYKVSFATAYGIIAALAFVAHDAFVAGKVCALLPENVVDQVSLPFNCITSFCMALTYGGFLLIYSPLLRTSPLFFFGGMCTYTCGYFVFGLSAALAWLNGTDVPRPYESRQQHNHSTEAWSEETAPSSSIQVSMVLAIFGSVCFFAGSLSYLHNARDLRPCKTSCKSSNENASCITECTAGIFGRQHAWSGALVFLLGSTLYVAGTTMDWVGVSGSLQMYQAAILLFVLGRFFFASDAIEAIKHGHQFVYGGSAKETMNAALAITLGYRLFRAYLRTRMRERELVPELPGGPWVHRARKNSVTGEIGDMSIDDQGYAVLSATIPLADGTLVKTSTRFRKGDTFRVGVDGHLVRGCRGAVGVVTPRSFGFMMAWFDEIDVDNLGILHAGALYRVVQGLGLGEYITRHNMDVVVSEYDLDLGTHTDTVNGLDILEVIMLVSSSLGCRPADALLELVWDQVACCDASDNDVVDARKLYNMLRFGMGLPSVNPETVQHMTQECSADGVAMTKADFLKLLLVRTKDELRQISMPILRKKHKVFQSS